MQPMGLAAVAAETAVGDSLESSLAALIGQREYNRWFRGKTRLTRGANVVGVAVCAQMHLALLERRFRSVLLKWARQVVTPSATVRFTLDVSIAAPAQASLNRAPDSARHEPGGSRRASATAGEQHAAVVDALPVVPGGQSSSQLRPVRRLADLSEFVVGPCNELALGAARRFCEGAVGGAAPLYLFGQVGTGKTHLLEGICRQLRRARPACNVLLLTSEDFTNHFTAALRGHTLPSFRQRFRTADALLVDDVDFLDGKRGVQEEFLHTIKQLETCGKLLALTADRHPRLLARTSEELKTRYLSGMFCRIEPPCPQTRLTFAQRKARALQCELPHEVLEYVAGRPWPSIRELEGSLQSLALLRQVSGGRLTVGAARRLVLELERDALRPVRLPDVERAVCDLFGVREEELKSSSRSRLVSTPRMLAMYLARRHTGAAYSEIGSYFGGRNHATVISAERKVTAAIRQDGLIKLASSTLRFAEIVERLEQQLLAG
jgi:chromosomal replication initiator protein